MTLCPFQHIYIMGVGQPLARVDFIPHSGTLDLASALAADELRFCPSVHGSCSSYIVYVGPLYGAAVHFFLADGDLQQRE